MERCRRALVWWAAWLVAATRVAGLAWSPKSAPRPRMRQLASATTLPPASTAVLAIHSDEDFLAAMAESKNEVLVVVKFYASWCRACKTIEPRFKRLAVEFHDLAKFYEIEFSENKELCRRLGVKKLPLVQFYRGTDGQLDSLMAGPSKFSDVRAKVEELLGTHHHHDAEVPEFTDISSHYDDE